VFGKSAEINWDTGAVTSCDRVEIPLGEILR
jgi:hypothetical protein